MHRVCNLWVLLAIALVIGGCDTRTRELETQNAELQQRTSQLSQDLQTRDQYIEEVTTSINEIYANLEGVKDEEKNILRETGNVEGTNQKKSTALRQHLLQQIASIDTNLQSNRKRISDLRLKLSSSRKQFAGLQRMVNNLQKTLEEREEAIAQFQRRVTELEGEVSTKSRVIADQDETINQQKGLILQQTGKINTGYYIIGSRKELIQKGIIREEGGFLWGLFGATTVLSGGIPTQYFTSIDKTRDMNIEVNGRIDEIIPGRSVNDYVATMKGTNISNLQIVRPETFWQQNYLVIVTD